MDNLHIHKSEKTPFVEFSDKGELRIEGRSYPENPVEFYEKPLTWLKEFTKNKPKEVNLHVTLEHFNTASSKMLLYIFKELEKLKLSGSKVNFYWYYSEKNEDMLEAGKDFESILKVPFQIVKLP
jgi:hypothetical protein